MARWVADQEEDYGAARYLKKQKVIELGAGVGVSGLSACLHAKPRYILAAPFVFGVVLSYWYIVFFDSLMVLTDLHEGTISNLKHNASLLPKSDENEVRVETLSWGCDTREETYDVVMGSDLVYCEEIAPLLASTVAELLKPKGYFLYVCPASNGNGRAGLDR